MTATYPLITVVTLRALESEDDGKGGRRLQGALGRLPAPVQEVIKVRAARRARRSLAPAAAVSRQTGLCVGGISGWGYAAAGGRRSHLPAASTAASPCIHTRPPLLNPNDRHPTTAHA